MDKKETLRRKFIKYAGISTTGILFSKAVQATESSVYADYKNMNDEQKEFFNRYEKWMDEFTEVIRLLKKDPENPEFKQKMEVATEKAHLFKSEIAKHMKDKNFAAVYIASIKRVKDEI
jgi:hypothetical protein